MFHGIISLNYVYEDYSYEKYGRKRAYHNQSFSHHMRSNLISYNNAVFNNGHSNKAFQEDALDVLDMIDKVSGILLDPPYPGTMNKYEDFYSDFDVMFETKKQFTNLSDRNNFMANLENIVKKAVTKTEYIILCLNSIENLAAMMCLECLKSMGLLQLLKKSITIKSVAKLIKILI